MPMAPPFFVSIHIPKTAGTTLRLVLERACDYRLFLDYPDYGAYFEPDPLIAANRAFIRAWFKGIHGHFGATRHLPTFEPAFVFATLRHPVARIISQYAHEVRHPSRDSTFHQRIHSGQLNLTAFAALDGIGNAMTKQLVGRRPQDYDLLLITERLEESVLLLDALLPWLQLRRYCGESLRLPRVNVGYSEGAMPVIDAATRFAITEAAAEDMALYQKAVEHLNQRLFRSSL